MKSLDVLQHLAKQTVDHERQILLAIKSDMADVEQQIEAWLQAIQRETSAQLDFTSTGATLPAFINNGKAHIQGLRDRLVQLQETYDAQMERVQQERILEKRYELLAERRAKQAALEAAKREQKTIDELVILGNRRR